MRQQAQRSKRVTGTLRRRGGAETRQEREDVLISASRLPILVSLVRLNLNIRNFFRLQTLEEIHNFGVVVSGIGCFDHQEKMVA